MLRVILVTIAVGSCGYPALPAIGGDAGAGGSDAGVVDGGGADGGELVDGAPGSDGGVSTPPSGLTYSANPIIYTAGIAITPNRPSSSGGAVAAYSVSPALPSGLHLDSSTGVIGGTPSSRVAMVSYTVTATNSAGSASAAVSIAVALTGFAAVGGVHTCAIASGSAWCWGDDGYGELGDDQSTPDEQSSVPIQVMGLGGVQAVAAGGSHACAIASGAAWCWGNNTNGQLGDAETTESPVPVQVIGLTSGVQAIAAGEGHSCAIVNGAAMCWGDNGDGQLGNNSTTSSDVPVQVMGLTSGVQAISVAGDESCALVNGGVECWGYNIYGQLGNNSSESSSVPVQVVGLTNGVVEISAGALETCALLAGGSVQCWGYGYDGELGDGSMNESLVPVSVSGLSNVQDIAAGVDFACALVNGGTVDCWGDNSLDELGDGGSTVIENSLVPVEVDNLLDGQALARGGEGEHACALAAGHLECWGYNNYGQLGNNTMNNAVYPVQVVGF